MSTKYQKQNAENLRKAIEAADRDPAKELIWKLLQEAADQHPERHVSSRELTALIDQRALWSGINRKAFSGHFLRLEKLGLLRRAKDAYGRDLEVQSPNQKKPIQVWRTVRVLTPEERRERDAAERAHRDRVARRIVRPSLNPGKVLA